jgi:hypothetical protein
MAGPAGGWRDGLSLGLRRAVLAGLALNLGVAAYVLWRTTVLAPFADELEWIDRWFRLQADGDVVGYLLAPYNFHRMVWTLGLVGLDLGVFRGNNLPLIVSGAVCVAGVAWLLARAAVGAAIAPLRLPAVALALLLAVTPATMMDASLPIHATYAHCAVFAVLSLVLAEGGRKSPLGWRGAGALAAAAASGLGSAAGLAVWPVLAWGALRRGDRRWLGLVLVAGALYVALYAWGQTGAGGATDFPALRDPAGAAKLALAYLTLPWTRLLAGFAWIAGLAVGAAAVAAVLLHGGRLAPPQERLACALILFALGTAAMAGLGRAGLEDPANVPLRYTLFVAPMQVGFVMLALPYAAEAWSANRAAAQALLAGVLLALLAQNLVMAAKTVSASDMLRQRVNDFENGGRTPEISAVVHPDLVRAEAITRRAEQAGLFRGELHLMPKPPPR